jgi:hypothetical protein
VQVRIIELQNDCVVVKAPRLIFLLPIIHKYFPIAEHVQVIRDGRDILNIDNKQN